MDQAFFELGLKPRHGYVLGSSKQSFHRIAYTDWGPLDAERVVLCVHGLSRQGRDFDTLAAALAAGGCRVVCPDLPGRGRSDWLQDPDEYGLPQYCNDMTVLIAALGAPKIEWVGTSLGGLIGMVMAALPRSPVQRLVVNDVGPLIPWSALFRIGTYLRQMPAEFADADAAESYFRKIHAPFGSLSDAEWRHLSRHSTAPTETGRLRVLCDPGIARAFRSSLFYNLTLWRYWDAITCPTLVLRGETSDLLPRDVAAEMTRRGPRAELIEFSGCGHAPPLLDEDQIEAVTSWLSA